MVEIVMGRKTFTYDSCIKVCPESIEEIAKSFDYLIDEESDLELSSKDILSDYGWTFQSKDDGLLVFTHANDSDSDFDLEEFEKLSLYLEKDSFYEETGDDGSEVFGAYVVKDGLRKKQFLIENGEPSKRVLLSEELLSNSTIQRRLAGEKGNSESDNDYPIIDTSFWLVKDKTWMEERKSQWNVIAELLEFKKSKKAVNIIKQYFLNGKTPDWPKLKFSWNNKDSARHLDLLSYLWLHPSSDKAVLSEMRDSYMASLSTVGADVQAGMSLFMDIQLEVSKDLRIKYDEKSDSWVESSFDGFIAPDLFDKEELLFELCFGDVSSIEFYKSINRRWQSFVTSYMSEEKAKEKYRKACFFRKSYPGLGVIQTIAKLLNKDESIPSKTNHFLQYDSGLEYFVSSLGETEKEVENDIKRRREVIFKALKIIINYDVSVSSSSRSILARNLISTFNTSKLPAKFQELWSDAKTMEWEEARALNIERQ